MQKLETGKCEHCNQNFGYYLGHCGFGDCSYAYCESCGSTAILSLWAKGWPKLPAGSIPQQEICVEMEQYLLPCKCGGKFKKGAFPRCPRCKLPLSPEVASTYIEADAAGTKAGWRWQRNWHETYCIIVENNFVEDNFKSLA